MHKVVISTVVALSIGTMAVSANAESGRASFYGGTHHGRPTASGERFNQNAHTCAHKSHAFGSILRVTLANGHSVTCRVSDRGPFIRGRIVDLSVAGAKALGIVDIGIAHVTVEKISGGSTTHKD